MVSLNWSPPGDKLFVSHVSPLCRVWESSQWTCEKWTNLAGRCKVSVKNSYHQPLTYLAIDIEVSFFIL